MGSYSDVKSAAHTIFARYVAIGQRCADDMNAVWSRLGRGSCIATPRNWLCRQGVIAALPVVVGDPRFRVFPSAYAKRQRRGGNSRGIGISEPFGFLWGPVSFQTFSAASRCAKLGGLAETGMFSDLITHDVPV